VVEQRIEELKASLRDTLYLDLDDFGLEIENEVVMSKFIGLWLHSAFQPVINLRSHDEVLGYEALLRPAIGADPINPHFAFDLADKQGKLVQLDRVARTLHMLNYLHLPAKRGLLFLNVHPKLLVSVNAHGKVFERILHTHSVPTHQVVIEIQENLVEVDKQLNEAIENYRDRGYRIGFDGFAGKRTNFNRLLRLTPDYIKLDLNLIGEAEANLKARAVLPKLIEIIQGVGAQPIILGIENQTQYQIAIDSGAKLLQGHYLGQPELASYWVRQKSEHVGQVPA